jgi:hypothetical protein
MASTPIPIKDARNSLKLITGKTKTICIIIAAGVAAKGDITLGVHRLDLSYPHPIVSIAHIDLTLTAVTAHNLVNAAGGSDQITYVAATELDTADQFEIKDASTIRLNEELSAASILIIEGVFEDN